MKEFEQHPIWFQTILLNEQVYAGNPKDKSVFIKAVANTERLGGFYWTESSKGDLHTEFDKAIKGYYKPLAKAYGINIDKDGNEVKPVSIDQQIEAAEKLLSELKDEKAKEGMAKDGESCIVWVNFNSSKYLRYSDGKGEFYQNGKKEGKTHSWKHSVRITVHADDLHKLND
jgi:hypothetical protein